jgi:cytochrome c biogenesis protein ResB
MLFSILAVGDDSGGIRLWLNLAAVPLLIGVSISIYSRSRTEWRRLARRNQTRHFGSPLAITLPIPPDEAANLVRSILSYFKWHLNDIPTDKIISLEKGRPGIWGSIVFHIGLITLTVGLLAGQLWGFRGILALTTGESFEEGAEEYQSIETGWFVDENTVQDFRITLNNFDPDMATPNGVTEVSRVRIEQGGQIIDGEVSFNHGLSIKDRMVHQGKWGYSPGLLLKDDRDSTLFSRYIRITSSGGHNVVSYADYILVAEDLRLDLKFYPDAARKDDSTVWETIKLANPLLEIELHRGAELLLSTALVPGDGQAVDGYLVAFPRLRYWSQLVVVSDPTLNFLYIGCAVIFLGLSIRTIFVRRQLMVSIVARDTGSEVKISGWAEKYKATFQDELNQILAAIQHEAEKLSVNSEAAEEDNGRILTNADG